MKDSENSYHQRTITSLWYSTVILLDSSESFSTKFMLIDGRLKDLVAYYALLSCKGCKQMDEFIDAYSDDQIYLTLLEKLVERDPVESSCPESIKYSSYCRLWSTMMIGSIEMMIKKWNTGDGLWSDIYSYFDSGPNDERIDRLRLAFNSRGIILDDNIFKDLLAIKYMRNAYVHGNWNDQQRTYVVDRGFPSNLMSFSKSNFVRFQEVFASIMNTLGMIQTLNAVSE